MGLRKALLWTLPVVAFVGFCNSHKVLAWARAKGVGQRSVSDVTRVYGSRVEAKLKPVTERNNVAWPPRSITLLAFKKERRLEVWSKDRAGKNRKLAEYPILAGSGTLGPKRKEGDRQVPEGFYRLPSLNPNSSYHLSVKVDYPNEEDIVNKSVPRNEMGGDIFVHGEQVSIGCIAIGNPAIEEVFCLAAWAKEREIVISPVDFRTGAVAVSDDRWIAGLYARITKRLADYR
jgi:L,D-peptidoglycan transpeptidase YkuD (ErfK/YbiS/YcfS/YnhG family)